MRKQATRTTKDEGIESQQVGGVRAQAEIIQRRAPGHDVGNRKKRFVLWFTLNTDQVQASGSYAHCTLYVMGPRNIVSNLLEEGIATTKRLKTNGEDATKAKRKEKNMRRSEKINGVE